MTSGEEPEKDQRQVPECVAEGDRSIFVPMTARSSRGNITGWNKMRRFTVNKSKPLLPAYFK
jgi:hypothetical protein